MAEIKIEKPSIEKLESIGVKNWSSWECKPSTFDWEYTSDETAYILEGKVKVITSTEEVEINKGDLVTFPKGLKCTWKVMEKIRKVYNM
ncbi:cupin domain-containing protein [bacterium]|nr:cupin domain-containing protein [bacterium]MBU0899476.1 cupin domain-containing protein [bacterium]MBU1153078.1 cupin domain-containing protein [bacterium]MBU1782937.1 cupin domain-containing protein [bacterium]MBU2599883.1 cupin domain-containing protein [bacterium]